MNYHGYEEVDHTADLAIEVWGEDFHVLLTQSAKAMYALMGVTSNPKTSLQQHFKVQVSTMENMLVDFLNEVLYLCEDKNQIFTIFNYKKENSILKVSTKGSKVESIQQTIKAVTFHDLEIEQNERGVRTIITFDV